MPKAAERGPTMIPLSCGHPGPRAEGSPPLKQLEEQLQSEVQEKWCGSFGAGIPGGKNPGFGFRSVALDLQVNVALSCGPCGCHHANTRQKLRHSLAVEPASNKSMRAVTLTSQAPCLEVAAAEVARLLDDGSWSGAGGKQSCRLVWRSA